MGKVRVTVGMPVYNGGEHFEMVLLSILNQTHCDIKIIISDNASTDNTEQLCRKYALVDHRIHYVRQPFNIGAEANFDFVLAQADSDYFMWAAADDIRSIDYIEVNFRFLELNPDYLASTCPTSFTGKVADALLMGDGTRSEDDPYERVLGVFNFRCANGRFYSLYRLSAVKDLSYSGEKFMASDVLFVVKILMRGKMKRLDVGSIVLGQGGLSSSPKIYSVYRVSWYEIFIPFCVFSKKLIVIFRKAMLSQRLRLASFLLGLNFVAFIVSSIYSLGLYGFLRNIINIKRYIVGSLR